MSPDKLYASTTKKDQSTLRGYTSVNAQNVGDFREFF